MQIITVIKMKKENFLREVEIDIDAACGADQGILYADIIEVKDINSEKLLSLKDIENIEEIEEEIYSFCEENINYLWDEYLVENYETENLDDFLDEAWDKIG